MRIISAIIAVVAFLDIYQANGKDLKCPGLRRNADKCRSNDSWGMEYQCMAEENGLKAIMNCVSIEGGAETYFCREKADGSLASPENYFEYDDDDWMGRGKVCITPRKALLSISRNYCIECSMTGILRHCPMNDPNFLECLCENHVSDAQLWCLSQCFNTTHDPPKCSGGLLKRHIAPLATRSGTVDDSTPWIQNDNLRFRVFSNGVFQYTLLDGKVRESLYTLPYTDTPYQAKGCSYGAVNRCYVSPVSNKKYCWIMCLREEDKDYTPAPKPTYGRFTETSQAPEQSKTLRHASHTQSSVSVGRIEVPTQHFQDDENEDKQGKKGSTGCQNVTLSLTFMLFILAITILAMN
ncbi:hypothetical protein F53441_12426 [Fusarium austroafricanum]|uniref:Extracellular membrane protein CFEM domain-containing protein n=1 Tax=Fusarium austroafricanum TaxID=2364996 RepID=A0A8H4JX46_9HYPO|nr:hypothetical protein F53441_12426 [Fusarium austroafricanum]